MSCASRSYRSVCLDWICRATLLLFCLFEHVDGFRCRLDELGGIASKSGFQIREDTNSLLGTTLIVQLRCDVCCSQSGAHHGQRDQHAIPSVAMWRTWEGARSSARGCGDPMSVATFFASAISLQQGKPPPLPCLSASAFALHLIPRFCLLTRVTALRWLLILAEQRLSCGSLYNATFVLLESFGARSCERHTSHKAHRNFRTTQKDCSAC